jgi:hypothetical protein
MRAGLRAAAQIREILKPIQQLDTAPALSWTFSVSSLRAATGAAILSASRIALRHLYSSFTNVSQRH